MKILVATHKHAQLPEDDAYLPVHVGHTINPLNLGYQPDDEGDNISSLNSSYSELTALYWAWKNLDADVVGLSHYRRYFSGSAAGPGGSPVLSSAEARDIMRDHDLLLARPRHYIIETVDSHYRHLHYGADLDVLRSVIDERTPEYLNSYDSIFRGRYLSLYNMFLMRRDMFDDYAAWLFGTLFETMERIDNTGRSSYQQRTFGFLGERLLNVWAEAHRTEMRIATRRVVNTEGEPKIAKGIALVGRKLRHRDTHSH